MNSVMCFTRMNQKQLNNDCQSTMLLRMMEFAGALPLKSLTLVHLVEAVDEVVLVDTLDLVENCFLDVTEG